jgi:sugar phosphate isomerase/epimerase
MQGPRRLGMSSNLYPQRWGEAQLRLTAAAGIAALELWAMPADALPPLPALERLGQAARGVGLDIWSVHAPYGPECNLASAAEGARRDAMGQLLAAMDQAQAAGARVIVVHAGLLQETQTDREAALVRAVRSLNELWKRASQRGLTLAVEYLPPGTPALGAGTGELAFLRDLVDGELSFCADVGHMHPAEDPAAVIRELAGNIATVHLSDNDGLDVERHWLPGRGAIGWAAVLAALDEVGYGGPLLLEGHTGHEPDLPRVLEALVTCGREVLGWRGG